MAFTGFDFRKTAQGGTNFVGDPSGNSYVLPSTAYTAVQGYGMTGSVGIGVDLNNIADGRLSGYILLSSTASIFRLDIPNGSYRFRLALGNNQGSGAATGVAIQYGIGVNDFISVAGTPGSGAADIDASGASVTDAVWLSNTVDVALTVTRNYIEIKRSSAPAYLKHFAYQVVPGPLGDAKIPTDDGPAIISATGTTTAGSAAVTLTAGVVGIFAGQAVTGPAVPLGSTVASVGPKDATTNSSAGTVTGAAYSFTLSSGTGVTSLSGGALAFSGVPTLCEKSPAGKLIGPVVLSAGAQNIAVTLADGVTPHPNLTIRAYNNQQYLAYTAIPFPGTSPTHTFRIVQTDASGNFTGSPYQTTFTWPVILAPMKPTDGSLLARISTPAFLKRKAILDKQAAVKWAGYKGQLFGTGNDVAVNSIASLGQQILAFAALSGPNKWFRIRCTNATIGTSAADWVTPDANGGLVYGSFQPENGGGLLIEPDAGQSVRFDDQLATGPVRGVHIRGLTFANTRKFTIGIRMNYGDNKPLTVLKVTGCNFGFLFNSQYAEADYANYSDVTNGLFQNGIQTVTAADQLLVSDCIFFGTRVGIAATGTRIVDIGWNTNLRSNNDFLEFGVANANLVHTQYQGAASLSDQENFIYLHDNICFDHVDNPQSYPFDASGNWTDPHADFLQYIAVGSPGGVPGIPSKAWMVFENNVLLNNITQYITNNVKPTDTNKYLCSRQFMINSSEPKLDGVFINNIGLNGAGRGIDVGSGGEAYLEYNTLLPSPVLPPTITNNPGIYAGGDGSGFTSTTGRTRTRKNIVCNAPDVGVAKNVATEDDYIVKLDGTGTKAAAEAVLTGPFNPDGDSTGRLTYAYGPDTSATKDGDQRKAMWAVLVPKIDAGAQFMLNAIRPGDSATLTTAEAATLIAVSELQPTGPTPGTLSLRWYNGAGETGTQVGSDVTLTVQ